MPRVYIIEDDPIMAECLALGIRAALPEVETELFADALAGMERVSEQLPDLILLDVLLGGPDGFTFLNELISYHDTAQIPVIIITSLDISRQNLEHYGVVAVLDKAKMTPDDLAGAVRQALAGGPDAD